MLSSHGRYDFSPITERPAYRWPNGAGLAVYVALGVEEYVFGEGMTEDILPGASQPDMVNASWRDYGNRVGAFRLLDRLVSFGIRPAVLLNTAVYDHARRADARHTRSGRGDRGAWSHQLRHARWHDADAEAAYIRGVAERIAREEGVPTARVVEPLAGAQPSDSGSVGRQGFGYLLDLRMDDQPIWLRTRRGRLLALPYALEVNDSSTIIGRNTTARDFADMVIDEFDEMREASRRQPLVMSIVVHSFISGQPFRLRALTRALAHIAAAHRRRAGSRSPATIYDAFVAMRPRRGVVARGP